MSLDSYTASGKNARSLTRSRNMPIYEHHRVSYQRLKQIDRARTVVVAAISPLEVHGPHLPLGEDLLTAEALARETAKRFLADRPDWNVLFLPPLPVATDTVPKHGSVNFPPALVRDAAYYYLRPFARMGFKRLAMASFHGGPRHFLALETAAEQLTDRKRDMAAVCLFSAAISRMVNGQIFFDAVKGDRKNTMTLAEMREDHHAGFVETSLALHLWPESVDEGWEELPPLLAKGDEPAGEQSDSYLFGADQKPSLADRARFGLTAARGIARAVLHFHKQTYHGYPAKASAAAGKRLFGAVTKLSAELLAEFVERGADFDGHSPMWPLRHALANRPVNFAFDEWFNGYRE
jgi:creatinine amidohydrolase